jgi:RimJ/RimL family protein N-acetyltransferase
VTNAAILNTERLTLRPFDTARHLNERYVAWLGDADVVRFSEQRHRTHSIGSCRTFVQRFEEGPDRLWAIEQSADSLHIGNIHAEIDTANGLADVAILIGERDVWGQGYGQEAWNAVLAWLLDEALTRKVVAGCMRGNTAMIRIMERSGMSPDGTRPAQYLLDGVPEDIVFYARFSGQ